MVGLLLGRQRFSKGRYVVVVVVVLIGHVNEYPTMHYIGIPRHAQSMIAYKTLTEYLWKFQ